MKNGSVVQSRERVMSSNATLRWASVLSTLVLAMLSGGVVAASPKPEQAPLHPTVRLLPNDATVQSKSYVS
jgi:hypothetical protein